MKQPESELASVLKLENGEIKSRIEWKQATTSEFACQPPKLSYLRYEMWCKSVGKEPVLNDWLKLHEIEPEQS